MIIQLIIHVLLFIAFGANVQGVDRSQSWPGGLSNPPETIYNGDDSCAEPTVGGEHGITAGCAVSISDSSKRFGQLLKKRLLAYLPNNRLDIFIKTVREYFPENSSERNAYEELLGDDDTPAEKEDNSYIMTVALSSINHTTPDDDKLIKECIIDRYDLIVEIYLRLTFSCDEPKDRVRQFLTSNVPPALKDLTVISKDDHDAIVRIIIEAYFSTSV